MPALEMPQRGVNEWDQCLVWAVLDDAEEVIERCRVASQVGRTPMSDIGSACLNLMNDPQSAFASPPEPISDRATLTWVIYDWTDMTVFSSSREKRLWLFALIVVVAIYSSLGLARTLADAMRVQGMLGTFTFTIGMLLVAGAIIAQGLTARPTRAEIAAALAVLCAYFLLFARMVSPEERTHLIEYGALSLIIYEALAERRARGRAAPFAPLLAILVTSGLGIIDECIQALLPARVMDPMDMLFNAFAAIAAVGASRALAFVRKRV